ncbi:MAG TPA: phosphoglucomutase, partial [Clostridiales bacterium]|nr:phosphoglucomutase [Clostridiales bacterium]
MDSSRIQYDRWLSQPSLDASLRAELSAMADDAHAIDNAFGCELTFGTGGLRGILGAGTNRMNVHVVRRAAQAVADYLSGTALPKRAAIGYDSRIGSARFARETAAVFAANGIEAYIYPR